jgi:hypothetical protein
MALLTPSPVVGEGWGEGLLDRLVLANRTLSLTLPHDGGENRNTASQSMIELN